MALNTRLSTAAMDAAATGIKGLFDATSWVRIYDGTQPTTPNTALGAQVLLAELQMAATAWTGPSGDGVLTAGTIASDASANATGTAAWFSFQDNSSARIFEGSVDTSGANLNFNSVDFQAGATVAISGFTLTVPMQGA
jgi:hypothetical protein